MYVHSQRKHAEDLNTLQDCERCLQWVLDNVYRAGVPLQCTRCNFQSALPGVTQSGLQAM